MIMAASLARLSKTLQSTDYEYNFRYSHTADVFIKESMSYNIWYIKAVAEV